MDAKYGFGGLGGVGVWGGLGLVVDTKYVISNLCGDFIMVKIWILNWLFPLFF